MSADADRPAARPGAQSRNASSSDPPPSGPPNLSDPAVLRRFFLLENLAAEDLARIAAAMQTRAVRAGEIFEAEDLGKPSVGFLWAGQCRIVVFSHNDRYVTLRQIRPGWHFGEIALLAEPLHSPYTLVTDEDSIVLQLPAQTFRELVRAVPALNEAVIRHLARTAMARADRLCEFALLDGQVRLQAELIRLARHGRKLGDHILINETHDAIAARIGMNREGVSRLLKNLAQNGLVNTKRSEIKLLDLNRLAANVARETQRTLGYHGDDKDWE